jgi:NAD(P)-dependent dehydrogenase (short-subunit alcohol dehydrogenase family)
VGRVARAARRLHARRREVERLPLDVTDAASVRAAVDGAGPVDANVSSSTTLLPLPMVAAYIASKAALNAFTQSLALELEPFGARARLVLPGSAPDTALGRNAQAVMRAQGVTAPRSTPTSRGACSSAWPRGAARRTRGARTWRKPSGGR